MKFFETKMRALKKITCILLNLAIGTYCFIIMFVLLMGGFLIEVAGKEIHANGIEKPVLILLILVFSKYGLSSVFAWQKNGKKEETIHAENVLPQEQVPQQTASFLQNILLSVGSVLLFFGVGEGSLRLLEYVQPVSQKVFSSLQKSALGKSIKLRGPGVILSEIIQPSENSKIIYELKPNRSISFADAHTVINSAGLRDYEYSVNKPPGTFRIVGLGDSVMFGFGVLMEDGFLKVLERELNSSTEKRKYEVVNFAIPGYNTEMEIETLKEKAIHYDPDLIIINFVMNDFDDSSHQLNVSSKFFFRKSYFLDAVFKRLKNILQVDENGFIIHWVGVGNPTDSHLQKYSEYLSTLQRIARKKGIPVLVVAYSASNNVLISHSVIREISQEKGFYFLDLDKVMEEYASKSAIPQSEINQHLWRNALDWHPNKKAHHLFGKAIFTFLTEKGLHKSRLQE